MNKIAYFKGETEARMTLEEFRRLEQTESRHELFVLYDKENKPHSSWDTELDACKAGFFMDFKPIRVKKVAYIAFRPKGMHDKSEPPEYLPNIVFLDDAPASVPTPSQAKNNTTTIP